MALGNDYVDTDCEEEFVTREQEIMSAAKKVLEAGIWLIRNGFGNMTLLPYAAPSGGPWHCAFHPVGRPDREFFRYTSASGARFLENHCGGSIRKAISAKGLANAIMKSVPDNAKEACMGRAANETIAWLDNLERALRIDFVPQAFHEYTMDHSYWDLVSLTRRDTSRMAPPPGYVPPGEELTTIKKPFWREAEERWESLAKDAQISIPTALLNNPEACYEFALRLQQALNDVGQFDRARILQAAIAALHSSRAIP